MRDTSIDPQWCMTSRASRKRLALAAATRVVNARDPFQMKQTNGLICFAGNRRAERTFMLYPEPHDNQHREFPFPRKPNPLLETWVQTDEPGCRRTPF